MNLWTEASDKCIPAHRHGAVLLDLVLTRDMSSHRLLHSTGIFYEDLISGQCLLSPDKLTKLIANCIKAYAGRDLAFRFGQRILPGHLGTFSQTLASAGSLGDALTLLEQHSFIPSPMLTPVGSADDSHYHLSWRPAFLYGQQDVFWSEAMLSALTHGLSAFSGLTLPWQFEFKYPAPPHQEYYLTHFRGPLRFNRPATRLSIPLEYLNHPWPQGARVSYALGMQSLQQETPRTGFLVFVRKLIERYLQQDVSQELIAEQLQISSATLKRKFRQHQTNFRQLLDDVRLEVATRLIEERGYTNEQVAGYLGFYDEANFRRSFKRWTGVNPSQYCRV